MAQHLILLGSLTAVYDDTQYTTKGLTPRVGDTYYDQATTKAYIFLKNTGATAITASLACSALTTNKSAYGCTLAAVALGESFAGLRVVGASSMAQNTYGWFQVKGPASITMDATGSTAEKHLVTSATTAGNAVIQSATYATYSGPATVFAIAETTTTSAVAKVNLVGNVWGV